VDPFVIRYLHERNLYNTDDAAAIDQFARDAMKNYPHLAHQTEYESWARERCETIVQKFAESWQEWERNGYGFLQEVNKRFQKSPAFEKAWALRRVEWLNKVHHGSSHGVIEWSDAGLSSTAKQTNIKEKTKSPSLKRVIILPSTVPPLHKLTKTGIHSRQSFVRKEKHTFEETLSSRVAHLGVNPKVCCKTGSG
jgi:hypothetical protein